MLYKSLMFCLLLALAGCGDSNPGTAQNKNPAKETSQGREETKKLQAVDAVGYDGKALQKKVDQVIETTEERQQTLNKAIDANK